MGVYQCPDKCVGCVGALPGTCKGSPECLATSNAGKKKEGEPCCFDQQCETGALCNNYHVCTKGENNGKNWYHKYVKLKKTV